MSLNSVLSFLTLTIASVSFLSVSGSAMAYNQVVSTGDYVRINTYKTTLNLRNAPCGTVIGNIAPMSVGKVAYSTHNTHKMACNGGNWTWVKVDFANVSGFVAAEYLLKLYNTSTQKYVEPPKYSMGSMPKIPAHKVDHKMMEHKPDMKHNQVIQLAPNSVWVTGTKVTVDTVAVPLQVRATPCGNRVALAWPKATGTLMNNQNNFVKMTCNGGTFTWLDVDFGGGIRGWVAREYLTSSVKM